MSLKPWREIAVPHEDVRNGTYLQAEFAADITRVHDGSASAEYQDPVLFFRRTFITEGMGQLLATVARRLTGKGGDPVIQLQTAFGGGKTHTMLAVMHMVSGQAGAGELAGLREVLAQARVENLPRAKVVVLDGIKLSPSQPREVDGHQLRTLWGELAWQLGGAEGYARVAQADATGTSPGKDTLAALINAHAPCVILIDEAVAYIRQFEEGKSLAGGTFDSNLTFIQALTEAMKATPTAALLASLPESEKEAGSQRGVAALSALAHYFSRLQAIWKPVSTEESFEIVRRRLFSEIGDRVAADEVCRAYIESYVQYAEDLPGETQEGRYLERMRSAYPIHPEVFDRLYEDWSGLPTFQRTRGVLKLMARVIHRQWKDDTQELLLMPGNLPLFDRDVHTELTNNLPAGWDPVIERDVDGERSEPYELEQREPRFGAVQACRRAARTIFLGSAPGSANEGARGIETSRVVLGSLQPGQAPHVFRDALARLETRLTFLNKGGDRWWLDVRPNLRREMEERKKRFGDADVVDEIRTALQRVMGTGAATFDATHYFPMPADVPDEWPLRLVALPPSQPWSRSGPNAARDAAAAILRMRGEQPRIKINRVVFLAADADQVMHLKDMVRALLAWRSIVREADELRLTLDNQQARQAKQYREQASETVLRLVREAYRWVIAPTQQARAEGGVGEVEWDAWQVNPGAQGLGREIDRILLENEAVVTEWAPLHLHNLLKRWFWKERVTEVAATDVWKSIANYLYFPRLAKSGVLQATVAAGAPSRDFFGLASEANDDGYRGFSLGRVTTPFLDALWLIEPTHAAGHERALLERAAGDAEGPASDDAGDAPVPSLSAQGAARAADERKQPRRFFGTSELNPLTASLDFSKLVAEVLGQFTGDPRTKVVVRIDIEAEHPSGFSENTVRAVRENGKQLGMKSADFD